MPEASPPLDLSDAVPPGLGRRFAAILYDALLLVAVLLVAVTLVVVPLGAGLGIAVSPANPFYRAYLLGVVVGFFVFFWVRGGQTLGMRVWHIRVLRADGHPLTLKDALVRFGAAVISWLPLGLGYFWGWFDRDRLTWHDRLSGTRLVITIRQ
jgi:uncharacterized RDD family membrane protein YckC